MTVSEKDSTLRGESFELAYENAPFCYGGFTCWSDRSSVTSVRGAALHGACGDALRTVLRIGTRLRGLRVVLWGRGQLHRRRSPGAQLSRELGRGGKRRMRGYGSASVLEGL